ncbi:MAG: hypothetical protein HW400_831 [Candidatus Levybacteria bacterium]|nr:hypothetical protein [Candidatus Levybacteria bacterium]
MNVLDKNSVSSLVSGVGVPTGSPNKEAPNIGGGLSSEPEINPKYAQELRELGMEVKTNRLPLTPEDQEMGMRHAGPHLTIEDTEKLPEREKVVVPMSNERIEELMKTGDSNSSGRWLAKLFKKIIDWGLRPR